MSSRKKQISRVNISFHNQLTGFQKLKYLGDFLGVTHEEISKITAIDPVIVHQVLRDGTVPQDTSNGEEIFYRLYQLRMLFSSVCRLGGYYIPSMRSLWLHKQKKKFAECVVKPPWYPGILRNYIVTGGNVAVWDALCWLKKY